MNYLHEQIIKTFEHLFSLRNYLLTRKSRTLYRINQEKLNKYRSQLSDKIIHRRTISTQTTFIKDINLSISMSSKDDHDIQSSNTISSLLSEQNSTSLSSSENIPMNSPKRIYIRSMLNE